MPMLIKSHIIGERKQIKRDMRIIRGLFDSISGSYDRNNLIISLGQTSRWREKSIEMIDCRGRTLDIGCGTGMTTVLLKKRYQNPDITEIDISSKMISAGRRNLMNPLRGNVLCLPFMDESFDTLITFYTLRNYSDLDLALSEMIRILKRGGRFLTLDAWPAKNRFIWLIQRLWLGFLAPFAAEPFGDKSPYRYLYKSIRDHAPQTRLIEAASNNGCRIIRMADYIFGSATAFLFEKL